MQAFVRRIDMGFVATADVGGAHDCGAGWLDVRGGSGAGTLGEIQAPVRCPEG